MFSEELLCFRNCAKHWGKACRRDQCGPCPLGVYSAAGKMVKIIFCFPEIWLYLPGVAGENPFTMYMFVKSSHCTLYISYNFICLSYLNS